MLCSFDKLPQEAWTLILAQLSLGDLFHLAYTSKSLRSQAQLRLDILFDGSLTISESQQILGVSVERCRPSLRKVTLILDGNYDAPPCTEPWPPWHTIRSRQRQFRDWLLTACPKLEVLQLSSAKFPDIDCSKMFDWLDVFLLLPVPVIELFMECDWYDYADTGFDRPYRNAIQWKERRYDTKFRLFLKQKPCTKLRVEVYVSDPLDNSNCTNNGSPPEYFAEVGSLQYRRRIRRDVKDALSLIDEGTGRIRLEHLRLRRGEFHLWPAFSAETYAQSFREVPCDDAWDAYYESLSRWGLSVVNFRDDPVTPPYV